jgi:S1-C subfamily serine protease
MKATSASGLITRATVLVALVAMLAGCAQPLATETPEATESPLPQSVFEPPADLEDITKKVVAATYVVECETSFGSGYGYEMFYDGDRQDYIVTTHTVIQDCLDAGIDANISDSMGNWFTAYVVKSKYEIGSAENSKTTINVAILKPSKPRIATLPGAPGRYQVGNWLMTASYPLVNPMDYNFMVSHGILSGYLGDLGYATTAVTAPGSNGGVVVNSRGEILGTLYTPDPLPSANYRYFLPFTQASDLMYEIAASLPPREFEPREG